MFSQLAVLYVISLPVGQGSLSKLLLLFGAQASSSVPDCISVYCLGQLAVLCVSILPSGQGSLSKLRVSVMTKLQLLAVWTRSQLVSVGQIVCVYSDQRC